jgi:endonuclease/exonuclease/phosphatase family metal-dependent hydrolase
MFKRAAAAAIVLGCGSAASADGLRVAAWNITFYNGGFATQVGQVVHGQFNGEALDPHVILLQEMTSASAVTLLVDHLNNAPNSPGDWAAGQTFVNSNINTALVYRESAFDLLASTLVSPGGPNPNHPRNVVRYDLRLDGYASEEATFAMYTTHMKAGSGSTDINRRQEEVDEILADVATLPAGRHYVLGGDFNTQRSSQPHFVSLVGAPYNTGLFRDPISQPGSWQNSSTFRVIHTQDPAGQMDDRYDIILTSPSLVDSDGADYQGAYPIPFNLSDWNDPNHSYRAYGNDGSTYNQPMRTTGNAAVGPTIAQAIITLSGNTGHAPVYLDVTVPARISVPSGTIDLGEITPDAIEPFSFEVGSAGDAAFWGVSGVRQSEYSFTGGPGVDVPSGPFFDAAGGSLITHGFTLDASAFSAGPVATFVDIASNDPDTPFVRVPVTATIAAAGCNVADLAAPFGELTFGDISAFLAAFSTSDPAADLAAPFGLFTFGDISAFISAFDAGCP